MTTNPSFFHFGCWNQGMCPENKFGKVQNMINSDISHSKPQFLVVAGDNYYPDKIKNTVGKKEKRVNLKTLTSGFECLKQIDIDDKIVLIGNHYVVTDGELTQIIDSDDKNIEIRENNCTILNTEQDNHTITTTGFRDLSENTLVIFIDTSLYEDDSEKFKPCYDTIFDNKSIDTMISDQHTFVFDKITSKPSVKNIIIIGHHPFTGIKHKKGTDIDITYAQHHTRFTDLLFDAFSLRSDTNNYYLCADLHLYQKNEITISQGGKGVTFSQYVAGIGGTKLDDLPKLKNINNREFKIVKYSISYTTFPSVKRHGYLSVAENNSKIVVTPHFVTSGGRARKTKRKRNTKRPRKSSRKRI